MPQKAKPVTRQELLDLAVTEVDAFTALRYLRHRETVPSLPELEQKGEKALPGVEGSLCDLYHMLWNPEPSVKEEVAPDRRYWQELLGQAMKSSAYQELHSQTQLKELQSVLGTIAMGESVLAMVPKEDQKKLQEMAEQSADAKSMADAAAEAEAAANAAQQLADAAQKAAEQSEGQPSEQQTDGNPQPGQGKPSGQPQADSGGMTLDQAKAIANQLAEQAAKAQADAKAVQELAEEAKARAEQMTEDLLGKPGSQEAEDKLRQLARMGLQAARDAQAKVQEVSDTVEAWGLEEGELHQQSIPEVLGLLERMKRNANLKKFAVLLGRIRKIAARKARQKIAGEGIRVTVQETGRDIKRAVPAELIALVNPALRVKALQRWTRGELRLFGQKTKQKLGYGPVIVCEDGSGSMEGAKQQWAKAVTLSLAHYAKLQKRSFSWIHFGSKRSPLVDRMYPQGRLTAEQVLEIAETFRNASGTDFEKPLRRAVEMIKQSGLKKADICFITDGECAVSDEFLRKFRTDKKALEFNVIAVLCDVGSSADATVREFSDQVERASAFTAEEAEGKIFRHL